MSGSHIILVIEDEPTMRRGICDNLEVEGYRVIGAASAREGREAALKKRPDLILLDLKLPDGDGINLCRQLRTEGLTQPIVMLTARGEEPDKVLGLEVGADDYMVKPFGLRELLARIRAHLRRSQPPTPLDKPVQVGIAEVDFTRCMLRRAGEELEVSAKELELLRCLVAQRGKVVARDTLLAEVWGYNSEVVTRTVDNFVVRLRKKIEPDAANPRYLMTIHGKGYKLIEQ